MGLDRVFRLASPTSLRLTLAPLSQGRGDPTTRLTTGGWFRTMRTPDGPATLRLHRVGSAAAPEVAAIAWGPGAPWALEQAPAICGVEDDISGMAELAATHPVVADLWRRMPGLRIPRTGLVLDTLLPTILGQKVTGVEAKRAWYGLLRDRSEPAPGPADVVPTGMRVPLDPAEIAGLPGWTLHRYGLERRRAETLIRAAAAAGRLERCDGVAPAETVRRLRSMPGIGAWTTGEVALVALGDADAVSVGDYHLKNYVAWALTARPRGTDEFLIELLAPFAPHRGRVCRLILHGHPAPPKFGPRFPGGDIARL